MLLISLPVESGGANEPQQPSACSETPLLWGSGKADLLCQREFPPAKKELKYRGSRGRDAALPECLRIPPLRVPLWSLCVGAACSGPREFIHKRRD